MQAIPKILRYLLLCTILLSNSCDPKDSLGDADTVCLAGKWNCTRIERIQNGKTQIRYIEGVAYEFDNAGDEKNSSAGRISLEFREDSARISEFYDDWYFKDFFPFELSTFELRDAALKNRVILFNYGEETDWLYTLKVSIVELSQKHLILALYTKESEWMYSFQRDEFCNDMNLEINTEHQNHHILGRWKLDRYLNTYSTYGLDCDTELVGDSLFIKEVHCIFNRDSECEHLFTTHSNIFFTNSIEFFPNGMFEVNESLGEDHQRYSMIWHWDAFNNENTFLSTGIDLTTLIERSESWYIFEISDSSLYLQTETSLGWHEFWYRRE